MIFILCYYPKINCLTYPQHIGYPSSHLHRYTCDPMSLPQNLYRLHHFGKGLIYMSEQVFLQSERLIVFISSLSLGRKNLHGISESIYCVVQQLTPKPGLWTNENLHPKHFISTKQPNFLCTEYKLTKITLTWSKNWKTPQLEHQQHG